MNSYVVVDASLVVKWLVTEDLSDKALALLASWNAESVRMAAPSLIRFEVANVIHRKIARGNIGPTSAIEHMTRLLALPIELRDMPELHARAIELAGELRQGAAYDTHYLALAEILECDMWTADGRLYRSAGRGTDRVRWIGEFRTV